jgi:hypothetical protein
VEECKPLGGGHSADEGRWSDGRGGARGRAVQVEPIKAQLKLPGTKRMKLKCHESLSKFAFNFNLRRYNVLPEAGHYAFIDQPKMSEVGRCRLTL